MRVISGLARGLNLMSVEGEHTRPTADRTKEALFSILLPHLENSRFLDLFSGTGAIGIEALSRGAGQAVFVDNSHRCEKVIKFNLNHTKLLDRAEIIITDYKKALEMCSVKKIHFDMIFMDPPYNKSLPTEVIKDILKFDLLTETGIIIVEQAVKDSLPLFDDNLLQIYKTKRYGSSVFLFLNKTGSYQ